jgi:hypothetical protein
MACRSLATSCCLAAALTSVVTSRVVAQDSPPPLRHERVWSMPQGGITQPEVTDHLGRFEKDASGSYNIYDRKGDRIGIGKPRPDGSIDLYDTGGRQGLEIRPDRLRRR